jgi:hypothetical protein
VLGWPELVFFINVTQWGIIVGHGGIKPFLNREPLKIFNELGNFQ